MEKNEDLEEIKRLLILLLAKLGADSNEISLALKKDPSFVRHMMPLSKIKKIVPR